MTDLVSGLHEGDQFTARYFSTFYSNLRGLRSRLKEFWMNRRQEGTPLGGIPWDEFSRWLWSVSNGRFVECRYGV